jgi:hypothetical protein
MRPMIDPTIAARNGPEIPKPTSSSVNPTTCIAHSPTCSTPTVRGRVSSRESTSTDCTSLVTARSPDLPGGTAGVSPCRASNNAA